MEAKFKVFIKNPQNPTQEEQDTINLICSKINKRLSESVELKTIDKDLIVSIFLSRTIIPDDLIEIKNGLYVKDLTGARSLGWTAFYTTSRAGLRKLELPNDVNNVVVVFSYNPISEEDVFALNKEDDKSTVNFVAIEPEFVLDDVIMNEDEQKALLRSLTIITERDLIFNQWGFKHIDHSTKSVLCFHGAPGTGKTMCAHAVASYLGKKILLGSYNQIQSKFVGEGEKNLVAYFKAAEEQDAVLFIDEADTFLSKRLPSSNENSKHYNSMSNELYQLIEKFNGCIVFASNHIKDFDPAVISRIIEPIEFKLPDEPTRIRIIKKLLPPSAPIVLTGEDYKLLASLSKGFSGRDIRKAMLLFVANSAYCHKVINNEEPSEIVLHFDEIKAAFNDVRCAKENLAKGISNFSITSKIAEENRNSIMLLQVAALTLLSDGVLDENEKALFNELSKQMGVSVDINDRDKLPAVEDLCRGILPKSMKIQMLDIACRMAASDMKYPQKESDFISNLSILLGFDSNYLLELNDYINMLIEDNKKWNKIIAKINESDYAIVKSLMIEYSEGASWHRLGKLYSVGGDINGFHIPKDEIKAKYCLDKAASMGYVINCLS